MDTKLRKSDQELIDQFFTLKTRSDVANLLEVRDATLIFLLYRNKENNYKEFQLPKKSGGFRIIRAPVSTIKILQRKLSYILYLVYNPKLSAHGFVQNKSIRTNADRHIKTPLILNIDLESFFDSITINRIIGLFMSKPYQLPKEAAVVLAQICCSPYGYLPQGAPTSPIVSNMICSRLDGALARLARLRKCEYTRYADDITFSSRIKKFASDIAQIDYIDGKIIITLGDVLLKIIENNGFRINQKKTKYRNSGTRQEVTGLVVNEKVNVKRKLMRQVRAMLYNYRIKQNDTDTEKSILLRKIEGKLNFIRSVRGSKDRAYLILANQYSAILGRPPHPIDDIQEIKFSTWFLEVSGKSNGTAFLMENKLITCEHVIREDVHIKACRWINGSKEEYEVAVVRKITGLDLAILDFKAGQSPQYAHSLSKGDSSKIIARQTLVVVGYPYYLDQREIIHYDVKVIAIKQEVYPRIVVDRELYSGMSGGAAVNYKNEVIGVICVGGSDNNGALHLQGIVPINFLDQIK